MGNVPIGTTPATLCRFRPRDVMSVNITFGGPCEWGDRDISIGHGHEAVSGEFIAWTSSDFRDDQLDDDFILYAVADTETYARVSLIRRVPVLR